MKRRRLMVAGVLVVGVLLMTAGVVFAAGVGAVNNGTDSSADGDYSTVGGGLENNAAGNYAFVGGGWQNRATGDFSVVAGGGCDLRAFSTNEACDYSPNEASGISSAIVGGAMNSATGSLSFVGGGAWNIASGYAAVALGGGEVAEDGAGNTASGSGSAALGGDANVASGRLSAVVGGSFNFAEGDDSIVLGGNTNTAEGDNSLAAGQEAQAEHDGSMVFAAGDGVSSEREDEFVVYADGGIRLITGEGQSLTLNGQDILSLIQSQQSAIEDLEERIAALEDGESETPQPPESFELMLEAEDGDLSAPFATSTDSNASGGEYISATSGRNTSSPDEEASLSFSVPEDGTYYLWARLYGPDEDSDAIYIGIDGSWARTHPASTDEYQWVRVARSGNSISGPYGFSLEQGDHEINVGHAELHARLDALFVTDDQDARP